MDSDSDIEIVPNSIDELEDHSLSSDDSLPSLPTRKRVIPSVQQRSSSSSNSRLSSSKLATSITSASTSKSSILAESKASTLKLEDATNSSSDVEIVAGPSTSTSKTRGAGTDLTNRIRKGHASRSRPSSSSGIGGFKSAAAILKEEIKKEKAIARRRSSSASSDAAVSTSKSGKKEDKSRDVNPALSSGSDLKGKKREGSVSKYFSDHETAAEQQTRQLEDEDDDILELPPPLRQRNVSAEHGDLDGASVLVIDDEGSSPGAAFRNSLNKFKAPSIPRPTKGSRSNSRTSLFTGSTRAPSTGITVLSDSFTASTSASTTTSKRARSLFTASTTESPSTTTQLEIPTPFLAVITKCPICNNEWTVSKDSKVKLNHIRKCMASKPHMTNEEVLDMVEGQVKELHEKAEEMNRRHLDGRTLLEGVLSKKGKDVQVVGVEKKKKKGSTSKLASDEEGGIEDGPRQVVLATQGGSSYSQATSTQVQKELTRRIKTAQRIDRGDFLNVQLTGRPPALSEDASNSASEGGASDHASTSNGKSILAEVATKGRKKKGTATTNVAAGVGSKNWLKAAQLLKAKEREKEAAIEALLEEEEHASLLSTSHTGTSITSTIASSNAKGKGRAASSTTAAKHRLVSYEESRYRIAEKVKGIAGSRTRRSINSDSSADSDVLLPDKATEKMDATCDIDDVKIKRPYRNPSELSYCLLDKAIARGSDKKRQGYDAWDLAGSGEDIVKDRFVSTHSSLSPPSSPSIKRYQPMSDSDSAGESDLNIPTNTPARTRHQSRSNTPSSMNLTSILQPRQSPPYALPPSPTPPPMIGKLSLSSPTSPRFPALHHALNNITLNGTHAHSLSTLSDSPTAAASTTFPTAAGSSAPLVAAPHFTPSNPATDITSTTTTHETQTQNDDSSSGLFKSSAALQALTQRLKAKKLSSSTNPTLARRTGAPVVATATASALAVPPSSSSRMASSLLPSAVYASSSASTSISVRTFASSSTTTIAKVEEVEVKMEERDTVQLPSPPEEKPKKPRGRPRKLSLETESAIVPAKASPKRKKKDASDSSPLSDTDVHPTTKAKQSTLAFTASKKGKSVATKTKTKKAQSESPSPKKKKITTAKGKESTTSTTKFAPDYPGMPDYDSWSKEKLQAATGRYGYKPAGTKKVLIGQLVRVWEVLHPEQFPVEESVPPWRARSTSPKAAAMPKKSPKASKKKVVSESEQSDDDSDASQGKSSPGAKKKGKGKATDAKGKAIAAARAKRKAALSGSGGSDIEGDPDNEDSNIHEFDEVAEDEIDTDTSLDELKSAGERLKEAVMRDEKFYMRILRYEPILFDDFEMVLASTKIKMSKVALRDWLDSQGVIFYYDQSTGRNAARNGARKRHA